MNGCGGGVKTVVTHSSYELLLSSITDLRTVGRDGCIAVSGHQHFLQMMCPLYTTCVYTCSGIQLILLTSEN